MFIKVEDEINVANLEAGALGPMFPLRVIQLLALNPSIPSPPFVKVLARGLTASTLPSVIRRHLGLT